MSSSARVPGSFTALTALLLLAACDADRLTVPEPGGASPARTPTGSAADPVVSSISPNTTPRDTTLDIRVVGTGYDRSARATFLLNGQPDARVRANTTTFVSQTEVIANVTVAADAIPELYDVQIALSTGKKGIGTELLAVQPILALNAGSGSQASGVNGVGLVVGNFKRVGPCGTMADEPFAWTQERGLVQLPLPTGVCAGRAIAANDAGAIVGWASGGTGILWSPTGTVSWSVERLGTRPDGSAIGEAVAIDEQGVVLVVDGLWTRETGYQPLALPASATGCIANDRSSQGQIAGTCIVNGANVGVVWTDAGAAPALLPTFPGAISTRAAGVNGSGVVAGTITMRPKQKGNEYHAVRWVPAAGGYLLEDLGPIGSMALAINDAGQIVGRMPTSGTNFHAFLWEAGTGMRDLGALSGGAGGSEARAINDAASPGTLLVVGWSNSSATRWAP